jgi:ribonuclease HII
MPKRIKPDLLLEKDAWASGAVLVAGLDEAGRGPLAGPVVAAAVILDPEGLLGLDRVDDSKRLSAKARAELCPLIQAQARAWAVGLASEQEIDSHNILQATFMAMRRAVAGLSLAPDRVLVDGPHAPFRDPPCRTVVHGDAISLSIAAASILAKVHRDGLMDALEARWPGYGFIRNKGYGTPEHLQALARLGPCPAHRKSFTAGRLGQLPGLLL